MNQCAALIAFLGMVDAVACILSDGKVAWEWAAFLLERHITLALSVALFILQCTAFSLAFEGPQDYFDTTNLTQTQTLTLTLTRTSPNPAGLLRHYCLQSPRAHDPHARGCRGRWRRCLPGM